MIKDDDWTRLARYFAGECSAEEAEATRRWIDADPARGPVVDRMRAAWEAAATPAASWDTGQSWQRLAARVRARAARPRVGLVYASLPRQRFAWLTRPATRGAAVAAGLALVAGATYFVRRETRPEAPVAVAPALREVRTKPGERGVFKLGDGTRVVLAPGSVLRYDPARFGTSTRELELDGQGFFAVTHDPRRPFLVRTSRTVTEDLGTEFVITDYAGDQFTDVVVASGTVAVRSTAGQAIEPATVLTRGESVRLDSGGRASVQRRVDLVAALAWRDGRLVFAETPVSEVVTTINRWFGIQVRLGRPALGDQLFTGSYIGQPAATVVEELAAAIGARVERQGKIVTLH